MTDKEFEILMLAAKHHDEIVVHPHLLGELNKNIHRLASMTGRDIRIHGTLVRASSMPYLLTHMTIKDDDKYECMPIADYPQWLKLRAFA